MRIHITGGSGTGTTTLAAALAQELSLHHADADNYYWLPTSPPFKEKRNANDRIALLSEALQTEPGVVVSGSVCGWGSEVEDAFDLVVFLYLPAALRVERLRRREIARYGAADLAFLQWASQYDEGPSEGRSLAKHITWLAQRTCPVLRLDQDDTVATRLAKVRQAIPPPHARSAA
jgi:adenylate kinase family enzyme